MLDDRGAALYEVVRQVRPLVLNSARVVEASLRPDGASVGMRAVLEVLCDHGPATVPAIAAWLDLARQGVQRHVNDLTDLGYVESRVNPGHRRSVLIATTSSGAELFDRIRDDELRHLAAMATECTEDDIEAAAKVLKALNRDVRQRMVQLDMSGGLTR